MDLDADQDDINSIVEKKLSLINGLHINFQDKSARTNPPNTNSINTVSTNRSNIAPSIYETAANSIELNIRKNFKGASSSEFYSTHSVVEIDPISDVYCDSSRRPLLNHQNSILAVQPTVWRTYDNSNSKMQGVDENIYHWKVLNLSRAKLKASSRTSALLSGFAMVAMVEINITKDIPMFLLITFAVCTVLLIAVHMLALMISTCILPNVEAVANLHFQTQKTVFESPHTKMNNIIELAWGFSTVIGILLFLVEIAILCWVKFWTIDEHHTVAWVATGLLIPILVIFVAFAAHFYLKLVAHKSEVVSEDINELEKIKEELETLDPTVNLMQENTSHTPTSGDHIV